MVLRQERLYVRIGCVALYDEGFRPHFLRRNHARRVRLESARRNAHQPIAIQRANREVARRFRRQKAQIDHAGLNPLDYVVIRSLVDFNLHARIFCPTLRHQLRQPCHADAVERADAHLAALNAFQLTDRLVQGFIGGKHLPDDRIECFSASGQRYAALSADKERKSAGFLHRADGMADCAGRQMQNLRGAGKAPLLRHGMKDAVFQQRHGFPP